MLMAQSASAEGWAVPSGLAAFDPPGFTVQDDRMDDSSENAPQEAVEPERFYHWQGNLTAFLEETLVVAGFDHDDAYRQAKRVEGLMNPKFDWKASDPERIVRFVLDTIGRASGETDIESVIAQLEARHGRLFRMLKADNPGAEDANARVPINSQAFYQWWGNIHAFVESAFEEMGYKQPAAYHAMKLVMGMMDLENRETMRYRETDWRNVDAHRFLTSVLTTAGFQPIEACIWSAHCLTEFGVPGWQMPRREPNQPLVGLCSTYKVKVVWCDGNGNQRIHNGFMHSNEYSQISACPASSSCPFPQEPWYELTHNGACIDTAPLSPVCVWIKEIDGSPVDRDCDLVDITLNCFAETNPSVNCALIETTCGGAVAQPQGCPDCQ